MLFTLLLTNFVWCVWNVWNKILLTQGNLPDQFHKVRKPQNRTMPTGTQPQIWKIWWTKNCPTSTSKVPYKFCQVIALLLTPAKNPLISFNKNTPRPHLTLRYPLPQALPLHQHTSVKTKYRLQSLPFPMAPGQAQKDWDHNIWKIAYQSLQVMPALPSSPASPN